MIRVFDVKEDVFVNDFRYYLKGYTKKSTIRGRKVFYKILVRLWFILFSVKELFTFFSRISILWDIIKEDKGIGKKKNSQSYIKNTDR